MNFLELIKQKPYFVFGILFLIVLIIGILSESHKSDKIRLNTPPRDGVLVDLLFVLVNDVYDMKSKFIIFPIIKDLETNKFYISGAKYNHSEYNSYTINASGNLLDYSIKGLNGKEVEPGNKIRYYLNKEIEKLTVDENIIIIDKAKYKYCGKYKNEKSKFQFGSNLIYNLNQDDILDILKDTYLFDGIIDL